jgi:hypothetical protein
MCNSSKAFLWIGVFDLAVFPERFPQEDSRGKITIGYGFDVHVQIIAYQENNQEIKLLFTWVHFCMKLHNLYIIQ